MSVFCEEVGLPVPSPDSQGGYILRLEENELRVAQLSQGRVILLGVIGNADAIATQRQQSRQAMLINCLALQAARFSKMGSEEILTIEIETDELVLWRCLEDSELSAPIFLQAAEALLNELEFWKNRLTHP